MSTVRRPRPTTRNPQSAIQLIGLGLAIAGCFGPWVDHETAALTVTGFELAEFAKFFPQVQDGVVAITRELFYLPFVTACILLALLAGRSTSRAVRLIVPFLVAALLLGALLPYAIVDAARQALAAHSPFTLDPQITPQLALVVAGTALALLVPLAHRLPGRARSILVALLALAGAIPALWQFALLRPLVVALYNRPPGLGWGLIVCTAGFALVLVYSVVAALRPERPIRPPP